MSTEAAFRPNTTCSILRTSPADEVDEFGDPVDNETAAATGIPFSIIHQRTRQFIPSENRMTIVHSIVGRTRAKVAIYATDRIKDERTGEIYMIEGMVHPKDPFGSAAVRFDLLHVNSGGQY